MVRPEGARQVQRPVKHYSLEMILAQEQYTLFAQRRRADAGAKAEAELADALRLLEAKAKDLAKRQRRRAPPGKPWASPTTPPGKSSHAAIVKV